jgi:hypothetical protein
VTVYEITAADTGGRYMTVIADTPAQAMERALPMFCQWYFDCTAEDLAIITDIEEVPTS